jgi:DNA-binding transcriptional ArsR family regulator
MNSEHAFRALADPSRRRMLKLLQQGSMTAGDLAGHFDFSGPSVSHHLSALKAANLVRSERRGQNIVYSLNTSVVEDVCRFLLDLLEPNEGANK